MKRFLAFMFLASSSAFASEPVQAAASDASDKAWLKMFAAGITIALPL